MPNQPITYSRLFDFSNPKDVELAISNIKQLGVVYEQLIKTVSDESGKLISSQKKISESFSSLSKSRKDYDVSSQSGREEAMKDVKTTEAQFQEYQKLEKQIKQLQSANEKLVSEKKKLNSADQNLTKLEKERNTLLARQKSLTDPLAASNAKLRAEINKVNAEMRNEAKQAAENISLFDKEVARLSQLQNKYKQVAFQYGSNSTQARKLKTELDSLYGSIRKVEVEAGQFNRNVGNYSSALKGLAGTARSFLSAFGIVGGITMFAYLIRDTFNLIKESQSLNKALSIVTETTSEYNSQLQFLNRISNAYGVNLNTLTGAYTRFYVATKGTKLEGQQTQQIFESVTKSLAAMGLSAEDTKGALIALEQMISKGKVTAQELRLQLGNRLPGAFKIFAEALGVSVAELDKLMSSGKLITEDVLPKFAAQLEKSLGVSQITKVDTLQAAQTRLTNAWISFIKAIEDGQGPLAKTFTFVVDKLAIMLQGLSLLSGDITKMTDAQRIFAKATADGITNLSDSYDIFKKMMGDFPINEQRRVWKELGKLFNDLKKDIDKNGDSLKNQIPLIKQLEDEIKSLTEARSKSVSEDEIRRYNILIAYNEQELKRITALGISYKNAWKEAEKLAKENEKINEIDFQIPTSGAASFDKQIKMVTEDAQNFVSKKTGEKVAEDINKSTQAAEQSRTKFQNLLIGIQEFYKSNVRAIRAAVQVGYNTINQFFSFQSAKIQANLKEFENSQNQQITILKNREAQELANTNLTADQKTAIQNRYAEQVKQLQDEITQKQAEANHKQAILNKEQAIFNATINVAVAVTKALGNPILAAAIGFLGAAQIALIAAEPIPAYEKGTPAEGHPGGKALINEKGDEMVITPDGKLSFPKGRNQIIDLPEGSHVLNHVITKRIVDYYEKDYENNKSGSEAIEKSNNIRQLQGNIDLVIQKETEAIVTGIKNAIGNQVTNNWSFTDSGQVERSVQVGNTKRLKVKLDNSYKR